MPINSKSDDMGMGAGDETMEQGKPPGDEKQSVTLSAEQMGGVMPKSGDKLTFCCTGDPDESGGVTGYWEPMEGKDDWEKGFMEEMSPRNGEEAE